MTNRILILCLVLAALVNCAASKRSSDSLPPTFLDTATLSEKKARLPFDHAWTDPDVNWATYSKVFIKPIRIDLLAEDSWQASRGLFITSREDFIDQTGKLASYFHEQLLAEFAKQNGKRLTKLASRPGSGVAVIEIAFTEIEFAHPIRNAGALAAPVPGASQVVSTLSDPYNTFALRITDGTTQKLLATAGDRKFAPRRLLNINKLTVASSNREICQLWAEEIAETLGSDELTTVEESTWRWLPW